MTQPPTPAPRRALRVRLVQMEVRPGQPAENCAAMLEAVAAARADGVGLLAFPEMAVPGYLVGDEWEHEAFLRECEACGGELRAAARGLTLVFGNVAVDWTRRNEDGRVRKYNALFVAEQNRFLGPAGGPCDFVVKALLPNYREFDDSRHFYGLRQLAMELGRRPEELLAPVPTACGLLGGLLCEDAWDSDYALAPLDALAAARPDLYVNISSSPYTLDKNAKRRRVFTERARRLRRPLLYVNNVGIQNNGKTIFTFDGGSCIYDACGGVVEGPAPFTAGHLTFDLPADRGAAFGAMSGAEPEGIAQVHAALEYGTRKFMDLCGVRRVVVGVSGGIDSAVAAALYARILPPDDLLLVNLPSRHNSATTRAAARRLAAALGSLYAEFPIGESVALTCRQLDGFVARSTDGARACPLALGPLAVENVQARDRGGRLLAALAAAFGGVFTCNANKAEATVGYSTLYGDLTGFLANLGDLWKGEVYALARHLNAQVYGRPVIPQACLDVTPSAELSAEQNVDAGRGDPLVYPYHDLLFRSWVEWWNRATPEDALEAYAAGKLEALLGYPGRLADLFPAAAAFVADLERWWNLYKGMGLVKRVQAPPVLAVKRRAFGFDHRESILGPHYTRRYRELKEQLLNKPPRCCS